jgi:hypothetical protein
LNFSGIALTNDKKDNENMERICKSIAKNQGKCYREIPFEELEETL